MEGEVQFVLGFISKQKSLISETRRKDKTQALTSTRSSRFDRSVKEDKLQDLWIHPESRIVPDANARKGLELFAAWLHANRLAKGKTLEQERCEEPTPWFAITVPDKIW
jgi:hypothetical protein